MPIAISNIHNSFTFRRVYEHIVHIIYDTVNFGRRKCLRACLYAIYTHIHAALFSPLSHIFQKTTSEYILKRLRDPNFYHKKQITHAILVFLAGESSILRGKDEKWNFNTVFPQRTPFLDNLFESM